VVPVVFMLASFGVVASGLLSERTELVAVQRALGIAGVGVVLYFLWRRPSRLAGK
jgi:hypothetical protein